MKLTGIALWFGVAMASLVTASSCLAAPTPSAATAAPEGPAADVVITGRTARSVREFVDKAANADPDRQIARWNSPVCLQIDGIAPVYSAQIRNRFDEIATSLRIRLDRGHCTPNVIIKLTDDADGLTKAFIAKGRRYLGNPDDDPLLDAKYKAGLLAPRAIRWFGSTGTINADGSAMTYDDAGRHKISSASLIALNVKESLTATIVVIDTGRLANVTMRQLADFLTLVSLSRPDIRADYAHSDSILSLFAARSDRATPVALTLQDRAFLSALYSGSGALTAKRQKAAVRERIGTLAREARASN